MSHQNKITSRGKVFGNSLHHFLMNDIAISKMRNSPTNHIYKQSLNQVFQIFREKERNKNLQKNLTQLELKKTDTVGVLI